MAAGWHARQLGWLMALLCPLAAGPVCAADAGLAIREVRFWSLDQATRIAIELTGEFDYSTDRLSNPERVFFDVRGAKLKLEGGGRGVRTFAVGDGIVRQIRVALTQPTVPRIVLDLEGPSAITVSKLANPYRLVVEVRPERPAVIAQAKPAAPPAVERAAAEAPREAARPLPKAAPVAAEIKTPPAEAPSAEPPRVALPARSNSDGKRSLTRALGLKLGKVVIDAGHGGHDAGTIGPTGLAEKDLVLDIALRLGELVETRLNSEVVYTRKDDRFLGLEERTALANEHRADLFLSIHANSSPYKGATGVETYYLNLTNSKVDLEVAARENAGHGKSIYELQELIQKIALNNKLDESRELASRVQTALFPLSLKLNPQARNRGVKKAPFVVLIGASMPSILTEVGFVSNAREEALLKTEEHRQRIAEAIFKGLSNYAATLSRYTVAQTQTVGRLNE